MGPEIPGPWDLTACQIEQQTRLHSSNLQIWVARELQMKGFGLSPNLSSIQRIADPSAMSENRNSCDFGSGTVPVAIYQFGINLVIQCLESLAKENLPFYRPCHSIA
jgi:hypothetical protein